MDMPNRRVRPRPRRAVAAWLFGLAPRSREPDDAKRLHPKPSRASSNPQLSAARAAVISFANAPSGPVCSDAVVAIPLVKNFRPLDRSPSVTPPLILVVL